MKPLTALIRSSGSQTDVATSFYNNSEPDAPSSDVTPLQAALQYKWGVLLFAIMMTALTAFILKQMSVRYTAAASVMIDARKLRVTDSASVVTNPVLDLDQLRTFMEQLKSPAVAQAVVEQLDLIHNHDYCDKSTLLERLERQFNTLVGNKTIAADTPCVTTVADATERLLHNVSGTNDSRSYIIRVEADASTAGLAATIANTYARTYVMEQRKQISDATEQASSWLTTYLAQLRNQVQASDTAVETFQRQNQLTPVRGETVVAQRLAELNTQLSTVTGELASKQSALRQAQSAGGGGQLSSSSPAVLASPVIQGMIQKQADLMATEADLRTRFGDNYPAVQSSAMQLARLRQAMRTEVNKVILGLGDEVGALTARKAELTAAVQALQGETGVQGTANIRLAELQREADTNRKLYESLQTRLHEVDAERHMQWPESNVVVEARPPLYPSFPRTGMTLTGVFIVSLGLGAVIAFGLSILSRVFRDVDQVEAQTGCRVLGLFPQPPRRSSAKEMVLSRPGSLEAETVHFTLANLIRGRDTMRASEGWVVMVTSALPGEGKSSLSAALGHAAVRLGMSVALLQGDLRSANSRADMRVRPSNDLFETNPAIASRTTGQVTTKAQIDRSYLHVLPLRTFLPDAQRLVASAEFTNVLRNLQAQYELVIIDTPPVLAVPDALSMAPLVDDTVLVVDWRSTPRRSVMATVKVMMRANVDITGIVLSKINLRQFARRSHGEGLYARAYKGYSMAAGD